MWAIHVLLVMPTTYGARSGSKKFIGKHTMEPPVVEADSPQIPLLPIPPWRPLPPCGPDGESMICGVVDTGVPETPPMDDPDGRLEDMRRPPAVRTLPTGLGDGSNGAGGGIV